MTAAQRVADYLKTADLAYTSRQRVASALAMSDTTLARRLRLESNRFSELIEAERKRRTTELMAQPRINASRLSDACGYASGHNFYRAFKSWFGRGYLDYRRQAIQDDSHA